LTSISNHPAYWWGCKSLADAFDQRGRQSEAITALETCSRNNFKAIAVWAPLGEDRMALDLHLADMYRKTGNVTTAREIEGRLRTQLRLADADLPLLRELRKRE
jgi:hypothetical protein